ncbi:MAG: hypothetical protein AAFU65_12555 [Pseudomonadota bacterium]
MSETAQLSKSAHAPRSRIGTLLIESVAIFLSVLLAFVVEQWREERNERAQAARALSLVRVELEQNLAELERVVPTRQATLQGFVDAMDELKTSGKFPQTLPKFTSPDITALAYELATDSGAVTSVEPADLLVIARAYESLDDVRRNDDFLNARNAQIRFNDGEQYLSGFIYYVNLATGNEPAAIEDVRRAIELLSQ